MRFCGALPLLLAGPVLVGCSEETPVAVGKAAPMDETIGLAGNAVRIDGIAMSWEGNSVHVGDGWEAALKLFPERRASYRLRSLPARFGRDFEAHGWETNEGEGYGIIAYKDLVVGAIYHTEDVEPDHAQGLLAAQRSGTGELKMNEVEKGDRHWYFWESGAQRLMVLIQGAKKGQIVTILVGDGKVLDALGATKPQITGPTATLSLPSSSFSEKP